MVTVTYIEADGEETELDVQDGWTLMQAAVANGIDGIEAECGGSCCCATCHCYIDDEYATRLQDASETELEMLEEVVSERKQNSRLACQVTVTAEMDGMKVYLPEAQS
jgi:ferredoxin, 2Fe-2S